MGMVAMVVLLGMIRSQARRLLGLKRCISPVVRYPSFRFCGRKHTIACQRAFAKLLITRALHDVSIQYRGIQNG